MVFSEHWKTVNVSMKGRGGGGGGVRNRRTALSFWKPSAMTEKLPGNRRFTVSYLIQKKNQTLSSIQHELSI